MLGGGGSRKLMDKKFKVLGYLIDAGYMNDEYQAWAERRYGVQIWRGRRQKSIGGDIFVITLWIRVFILLFLGSSIAQLDTCRVSLIS